MDSALEFYRGYLHHCLSVRILQVLSIFFFIRLSSNLCLIEFVFLGLPLLARTGW